MPRFPRFLSGWLFILSVFYICHCSAALAAPGDLKWKFQGLDFFYGAPTLSDNGTLYVMDGSGMFYALSPDGTQQWSRNLTNISHITPVIDSKGTIYTGVYRLNTPATPGLHAFTPDGTAKWTYKPHLGYGSPALGTDGTIYFSEFEGEHAVHALNPDGSLKWKNQVSKGNMTGLSIGPDGTIYASSEADKLYALTPDGDLKWSFSTKDEIRAAPAVDKDGTIYIASKDWKVYALNPDGSKRWEYETGHQIENGPVIASDGTIYIGSNDYKMHALTPEGKVKWTYKTGRWIQTPAAIGSDGTIYFGSHDKKAYALNPDGTLKWQYKAGNEFGNAAPVIAKDGTVYFGNWKDYTLYAFEGESNGYWPTLNADMQRSGRQLFSDCSAARTQAPGATASVGRVKTVQNTAATLCACSKGLAGFTPVSMTTSFNATVAPAGVNATFFMNTAALDGITAEFWLYGIGADGTSLPYLSYARSANHTEGAWWIARPDGTICNRTATLSAGTQYSVNFVIRDNGEFDKNATDEFIHAAVVLGCSSVSPSLNQPAGVLATVANAARKEVLPGDMAFYSGWTDFQTMGRFAAFNGSVSPANSTGVFRFNSTVLSGPLEDLQLLKLFEANFSVLPYTGYAPSNSNFTDGQWWLTYRNNTYILFNATLTAGTNYFINLAVRDNGPYDADPAPGSITDPAVLGSTPATFEPTSTGCMFNPAAGFAPELLLLMLAPLLFRVRRRS